MQSQTPDKIIGLEVMKHPVAIWKFLDGRVGLSMKWERLAEPRPQMCRGEGYQDMGHLSKDAVGLANSIILPNCRVEI